MNERRRVMQQKRQELRRVEQELQRAETGLVQAREELDQVLVEKIFASESMMQRLRAIADSVIAKLDFVPRSLEEINIIVEAEADLDRFLARERPHLEEELRRNPDVEPGAVQKVIDRFRTAIVHITTDLVAASFEDKIKDPAYVEHHAKRYLGFKPAFTGLGDDWTDRTLMLLGARFWRETVGEGMDLEEAENYIASFIHERYFSKRAPHHVQPFVRETWRRSDGTSVDDDGLHAKQATAVGFGLFAFRWAVDAFQKLTTSHTYAAALMASDASRECIEDIELPWRAFMVLVPNGMLAIERDGVKTDYTRIVVACLADGSAFLTLYDPSIGDKQGRVMSHGGQTLADMLHDAPAKIFSSMVGIGDAAPAEVRLMMLAKRLVAGLILSLQHRDNFKSKTTKHDSQSWREGRSEPHHRIVYIGKPLRIDCREAVRDYLLYGPKNKKGAPPSVQVLVRGHYKRQVIGVGRTGRKVIWIEPYWRGPEDAPILTRPKVIG